MDAELVATRIGLELVHELRERTGCHAPVLIEILAGLLVPAFKELREMERARLAQGREQ